MFTHLYILHVDVASGYSTEGTSLHDVHSEEKYLSNVLNGPKKVMNTQCFRHTAVCLLNTPLTKLVVRHSQWVENGTGANRLKKQ